MTAIYKPLMNYHVRIQRGAGEGRGRQQSAPPENHKNIGFLSNIGPDPLKAKPAFDVGPSSARQRNDI